MGCLSEAETNVSQNWQQSASCYLEHGVWCYSVVVWPAITSLLIHSCMWWWQWTNCKAYTDCCGNNVSANTITNLDW